MFKILIIQYLYHYFGGKPMSYILLTKVKNSFKNRDWKKTIELVETYISETNKTLDEETVVFYAKSLRLSGYSPKAEKILLKYNEVYPKSEDVLLELNNLYDSAGEWKSALNIAYKLIDLNSNKADHYFILGRILAYLNKFDEAKEQYTFGLSYKHGISFNELTNRIRVGFADKEMSSEYVLVNGRNNFGAFIHSSSDKQYFTKISKYRGGSKREERFYKDIVKHFPELEKTTPKFIDSMVIDGILYLTIELIEDNNYKINNSDIDKIINSSTLVSKIKYRELIKIQRNRNYLFTLKKRPISIVIFFTQIHQKNYNERLFLLLYKMMENNNYSMEFFEIIESLQSLIMNNKLYAFINPDKHYSLIHGDLIASNIKAQKNSNSNHVYMFDWATFTTGPRFIDLSRYFTSRFTPYETIKSKYLFNDTLEHKLSIIEQIFFLYSLILFYLVSPKKIPKEKQLNTFMLPALHDLEILVKKFRNEHLEQSIDLLIERNESHEKEIENLKIRIRRHRAKNKSLQNKLDNILTSKSWKITAPLRKLMEWRKKK